jgi:hypothetical protein
VRFEKGAVRSSGLNLAGLKFQSTHGIERFLQNLPQAIEKIVLRIFSSG